MIVVRESASRVLATLPKAPISMVDEWLLADAPFMLAGRGIALALAVTTSEGEIMDFASRLDGLQRTVADAKNSVQAATSESAEQLRGRIDQAQTTQNQRAQEQQRTGQASTGPGSKWDQMRSDAAKKMNDVKARIDRRNAQIDADMAATDAELAEADANDAIDYAAWTVDNARLAVLDAIDARQYADAQAGSAS